MTSSSGFIRFSLKMQMFLFFVRNPNQILMLRGYTAKSTLERSNPAKEVRLHLCTSYTQHPYIQYGGYIHSSMRQVHPKCMSSVVFVAIALPKNYSMEFLGACSVTPQFLFSSFWYKHLTKLQLYPVKYCFLVWKWSISGELCTDGALWWLMPSQFTSLQWKLTSFGPWCYLNPDK